MLSGPQWAGNFLADGISQIRMDVNNGGPADLSLRLLLEDFEALGPPLNLALSKNPVVVLANSGWQTISFNTLPPACSRESSARSTARR